MGKEQSLRMNFWTPEFHVWGEGLDAADMPWYLLYDYVEVFTYDEADNEFHLHWRDDFDTFNSDRWHKASGGFDQNSSIFYPENVSVKSGNLVLKMEPDEVKHHTAATHHHRDLLHHRRVHSRNHEDKNDDDEYWRDDSSDSEADWNEYQEHFGGEGHDSHEFWEAKRAYKVWKHERKLALRHEEEQLYGAEEVEHRHYADHEVSDDDDESYYLAHMEPLPHESYLEFKQRKYERKLEHKRTKEHFKEMKYRYKHQYDEDEDHHTEHHYQVGDHYQSTQPHDQPHDHHEQLYEAPEIDYRRWKYEKNLPEKQRDVEEKQRDADAKFAEFRARHPYMSEEELELHHHHYEVEPFFASHAEKKAWKLHKKEEKALREERRRVLKHEREAREIEEAYKRIMDPGYDGDHDVDHYIEEHRLHASLHEPDAPVTHHYDQHELEAPITHHSH